jgi:hypothetical protein
MLQLPTCDGHEVVDRPVAACTTSSSNMLLLVNSKPSNLPVVAQQH